MAFLSFLQQLKLVAGQQTIGAGKGTEHLGSSFGALGSVSVVGHQCQAGNTVLMEAVGLFWCRKGAPSPTNTNAFAVGRTLLSHLKDFPWILDQCLHLYLPAGI